MSSQRKTIYLCPDTIEGIFTAIYKAWDAGTSHTDVQVNINETLSFLNDYLSVDEDLALAGKVSDSISRKLGEEVYYHVYRAALTADADKASVIYHFLIKAFRVGPDIMEQLSDTYVNRIFKMTRYFWNEHHKYLGFIRFEELENGVLISRINPVNNILPVLMKHFEDRLLGENWIILDTGRNLAAIHTAKKRAILSYDITEEQLLSFSNYSKDEDHFKQLWNRFFDTIAISERKNTDLQRNLMPLRYRKYMPS